MKKWIMLILSIVFAVIAVDLYREYTIASEKGDSDQYLYLFMCFGFGLYSIVAAINTFKYFKENTEKSDTRSLI